ncbi:hypothetical protein FQN54_009297 [Arachnomyces sp. PD_36]|nr:hypothetical protein FQN54_009297 [Arachnomyces sp. PD_36]
MKFSAASFLALSVPLAAPAAVDSGAVDATIYKRADCLVNAKFVDVWHEDGLTRRRCDFSSENTPASRFCKFWDQQMGANAGSNSQCWTDDNYSGHADGSWVLGAGGDASAEHTRSNALEQWKSDTLCDTG